MGRTDPLPTDSLQGVHVLVVDDDRDARDILRTVLEYCGALVTACASARQAMRVLHRVVPDVVVTDIVMPGRNGYWLLRELRRLPPGRGGDVPVLACTAYAELHGRERLLAAGFQDHLRKPVDIALLSRLVATLARRRG
jgi:CheY-like chemotaxis protein